MLLREGGASFESIAVLWRKQAKFRRDVVPDIGNDTQIWLEIQAVVEEVVCLAVLYLPNGSADGDAAWRSQLDVIGECCLILTRRSNKAAGFRLMLAGDVNAEPESISGVPDRVPGRGRIWQQMMDE